MAVRRQDDVIREFIITYQRNPCLWMVKSNDYMDRNKKEEAYQLLVEVLKQINPDADTDVVKKKINSMRSCFRKEYKKVVDSKRSGSGSEDIYSPTLWYFDLLMFLKDQEIPRNSIGTDDPGFITRVAQSEYDSDNSAEANSRSLSTPDIPATSSTSTSVLSTLFLETPRRQRKRKIDSDSILQVVGDRLQNSRPEDEFDIVERNVAEKLRKLEPSMRIFAEKLINDTFFEAQLKTLNRYAHITIPQPSKLSTALSPPTGQSYHNLQTLNSQPGPADSARQYFSQFFSE